MHPKHMLKKKVFNVVSESSVSQIYFELVGILKNQSTNFRGFTADQI